GGKGRCAPVEPSRVRPRGLCSARILSRLSSLAKERLGDREGPAAVLLGRQQGSVIFDGHFICRGDCPADSTFSLKPVCTAGVRCWPDSEAPTAAGRVRLLR